MRVHAYVCVRGSRYSPVSEQLPQLKVFNEDTLSPQSRTVILQVLQLPRIRTKYYTGILLLCAEKSLESRVHVEHLPRLIVSDSISPNVKIENHTEPVWQRTKYGITRKTRPNDFEFPRPALAAGALDRSIPEAQQPGHRTPRVQTLARRRAILGNLCIDD